MGNAGVFWRAQKGEFWGVHNVHFWLRTESYIGGLGRIAYVFWSSQCLQGLECGSSPTSGTAFPLVRGDFCFNGCMLTLLWWGHSGPLSGWFWWPWLVFHVFMSRGGRNDMTLGNFSIFLPSRRTFRSRWPGRGVCPSNEAVDTVHTGLRCFPLEVSRTGREFPVRVGVRSEYESYRVPCHRRSLGS